MSQIRFSTRRTKGVQVVAGMGLREGALTVAAAIQALWWAFMFQGADFGVRMCIAAVIAGALLFVAHYRNPINRMTLEQWLVSVLLRRLIDQRRGNLVATHQTARLADMPAPMKPPRNTAKKPAKARKPAKPAKAQRERTAKVAATGEMAMEAIEISWGALIALFFALMTIGSIALYLAQTGSWSQALARLGALLGRLS